MKFLVQVQAYSMMGAIHVVTTVRAERLGVATELEIATATVVPDDGTDDPVEFAIDAVTAALENLYDCRR